MKRYTVVWNAIAREQLAEIWMRAADRGFVAAAADDVDRRLADHEVIDGGNGRASAR